MSKEKKIEKANAKARKRLENAMNNIYVKFTLFKEVHETAYKLNPEYKYFWDKHPEKTKQDILKNQKPMDMKLNKGRIQEMQFGLGTLGFRYGMKRLFSSERLSPEEKIEISITCEKFTKTVRAVNETLWRKPPKTL
ncbi:hypothetical protein [Clostridium sp.]|uniref:hypothetical protein n=1 Tax=Clostridium sp. TaxID=1506 RepID=UPI0032179DD5